MGYYLLDNPPARPQSRAPRRAPISGVVVWHNSGGPRTAATNLARFIENRSDVGSYHELGNSDADWILMLPDDVEAFGVATGDNSHAFHLCATGNDGDFRPDQPATKAALLQLAARTVEFWKRTGVTDPELDRFLTRDEAQARRPGVIHHGDLQPADRSDAWARSRDRDALDAIALGYLNATWDHHEPDEDDDMPKPMQLLRDKDNHIWLCDRNTKVHVPSGEHVNLLIAVGKLGGDIIDNRGPDSSTLLETLGTLPNGRAV